VQFANAADQRSVGQRIGLGRPAVLDLVRGYASTSFPQPLGLKQHLQSADQFLLGDVPARPIRDDLMARGDRNRTNVTDARRTRSARGT
jgi:hypothetical protein